jgi:hypothetical protein
MREPHRSKCPRSILLAQTWTPARVIDEPDVAPAVRERLYTGFVLHRITRGLGN